MRLLRTPVLVAASLIVFGLALGARGLVRPIGQDDVYYLMAARILAADRSVEDDGAGGTALRYQAPVYPWLVSIAQRILASDVVAARGIGWMGYALTGGLLFALVRRVAGNGAVADQAALLAVALYLFNPIALQAIAMIDIDPAVLPAWVVLWLLLLFRCAEAPRITRCAALAGATAVGFGLKLSTPPVVVGVSIVVLGAMRDTRPALLRLAAAVATGGAVFAAGYTYWGAPRGLMLANLIHYVAGRMVPHAAGGPSFVGGLPTASIELALWLSPFLLMLAGASVIWGLTRMDWRRRLMAVLAGILLIGYLVIGGMTFGYPKYHVPVLPILCALVGLYLAPILHDMDRQTRRVTIVLVALLIAWNLFVVGDLIYALRYTYREAAALADPRAHEILAGIAWRSVALFAPIVLAVAMLARGIAGWGPRLCASLLAATVGSNLALDISQARAAFSTSHYGESEAATAADFLRARLDPGARIIATREMLFLLGKLEDPANSPLSNATWNDPTRFRSELADPRVEAVVYSVAANTIGQFQRVFRDPVVQLDLATRFRQKSIGSYSVWWRTGP